LGYVSDIGPLLVAGDREHRCFTACPLYALTAVAVVTARTRMEVDATCPGAVGED
jgi:hypothetical protein